MAKTLQTMLDRIADDLTRSDLASQAQSAILDAVDHYAHDRFWFNVTRSKTFPTVAGQQAYGSAALAEIPDAIQFDGLFLKDGASGFFLDWVDADEAEWLISGVNTAPGRPTNYTFADAQLLLWPVPIAAFTIRPLMHYRLPALALPTDSSPWLNEAEQLIRAHAKMLLYANALEDDEGAARMQAQIPAHRAKLDAETSRRLSPTLRTCGRDF
ncbi:conserved hypothetical protein [Rhodopseudomonas palustris TIE-1]|uniref:phage adaptor protein n=1 Tax=Rhodopseudomonas palustris TaxID=1076 RepID=UPI000164A8F4|nr:hypothetical protein [Rhodopseudomonas palustris]ACF01571.1 conserved hypothetical protein [Rhodopseudomonas palustris TIE-1]